MWGGTIGIVAHIFWTVLGVVLVSGCLWRFGRKPQKSRYVLFGLLGTFVFVFAFVAFTVVGTPEGTRSNSHFYGILIGVWLLLTFVETKKLAWALSFCLLIYMFALRVEYMNLAQSRNYTDNPKVRLEEIKYINELRAKKNIPPVKNIEITPVWHTWLTNLQEIKPPFGDRRDFEDVEDAE